MPTYKKMRETFDKAWKMTRPPFERVQVNYEGKMLDGYFRKPNGPAGKKFPAVIPFQGADTMAEATILGGGQLYGARHGLSGRRFSRTGRRDAPEGSAPAAGHRPNRQAMIDYLETRPDVDATRIGMQGISMGGYGVPRAASGENPESRPRS